MTLKKAPRVLIAEDDFLVGEMIQGVLEDIGYTVIDKAIDGRHVVELTQSLRPDVILMDIEMPVMGGLEAARHIQACCPTPVVVLTAYETPVLVEEASAAGVGAYLIKPPNALTMERAITIALARFEDMMELRRLNSELRKRNEELEAALAKVKLLSGLLPICAACKKIRDDEGYWQQVEVYLQNHSEVQFSHGVCPECMQHLYPEVYAEMVEHQQDIVAALTHLGQATLEAISARVGLPPDHTFHRLQDMVSTGQVRHQTIDGEILYKLT